MRLYNEIDGTERNETRQEIVARHLRMADSHRGGMELLESILDETGLNMEGLTAGQMEQKELAEHQQNEGLTSEINTSTALISVRDTLDNVADLLRRHPYGYTDGDGEGADILTSGNTTAVLTPKKVDPYADKKPILKNGKLLWVKV